MITDAYSYFTENGNTGYYDLSVSFKEDGVCRNFTLRTGVEECHQNFMLCTIDDILIGELTVKQQEYWDSFKSKDVFKELVEVHDKLLLSELLYDLNRKIKEVEMFLLKEVGIND